MPCSYISSAYKNKIGIKVLEHSIATHALMTNIAQIVQKNNQVSTYQRWEIKIWKTVKRVRRSRTFIKKMSRCWITFRHFMNKRSLSIVAYVMWRQLGLKYNFRNFRTTLAMSITTGSFKNKLEEASLRLKLQPCRVAWKTVENNIKFSNFSLQWLWRFGEHLEKVLIESVVNMRMPFTQPDRWEAGKQYDEPHTKQMLQAWQFGTIFVTNNIKNKEFSPQSLGR